jgi:hypothetical protein
VASIQIFDLTGRLVATIDGENQKNISTDFNNAKAIYLAKIYFLDGTITSQKLINK